MILNFHLLFEAFSIAIWFVAISVGWSSFRYTERAQAPFSWSGVPALSLDLSAEISAEAEQTRAMLTARTLYAVAASLSAAALVFGVAAAHSDNRLVLNIATAIAVCFLVGALTLRIRNLVAMGVSRAREAFKRFYVGSGLCKYEEFEPALARFARENPREHRLAHRSLVADQKAAKAERERQMEDYATAMERALT